MEIQGLEMFCSFHTHSYLPQQDDPKPIPLSARELQQPPKDQAQHMFQEA